MTQERCDLYGNGGKDDCGGPLFDDPQPEGVDLRVCAFHTLMNRNEWINEWMQESIAARQRVTRLKEALRRILDLSNGGFHALAEINVVARDTLDSHFTASASENVEAK